jgi:5-phospho-D-xylono-1,4-lactonase
MKKIIRTILGDISPSDLGRFNYHEHAFQVSPLLPDDDLADFEKSKKEFKDLKDSGFDSYLEATPYALGRNPVQVAEIARSTNLKIIHTTGFHKPEHYKNQPTVLSLTENQKAEIIEQEITAGFDSSNFKAGVIKAGVGVGEFSKFEITSLKAAAKIVNKLGVALMIHLDQASDAESVLNVLAAEQLDLTRVLLAHADSLGNLEVLKKLADRGAFLGFDRAARLDSVSEVANLDLFKKLVEQDYGKKILFGGDLARSSRYLAYDGSPGLAFLYKEFLPKLEKNSNQSTISKILVENPISWLSFTP